MTKKIWIKLPVTVHQPTENWRPKTFDRDLGLLVGGNNDIRIIPPGQPFLIEEEEGRRLIAQWQTLFPVDDDELERNGGRHPYADICDPDELIEKVEFDKRADDETREEIPRRVLLDDKPSSGRKPPPPVRTGPPV